MPMIQKVANDDWGYRSPLRRRSGGTPMRSIPWHVPQAVVLPCTICPFTIFMPPVVTRSFPFPTAPLGTYAIHVPREFRSVWFASTSVGTSMIRPPIGSVSVPGSGMNMPPDRRVFGTVAVSTTLIQDVAGIGTIDADLASLGHTRNVVVASPMFLSAFAAVATSDLIATVPRRLAARFANVFGLAAYELPFPASRFHIDLIRSRSSLKDRALDWLTEEIQMVLVEKGDGETT